MKRALLLAVTLTVGCSTTPPPELPEPKAAPVPVVATDPRVNEMQVLLTELLDRLEVMNARLQRLEGGQPPVKVAAAAPETRTAERTEPQKVEPQKAAPRTTPSRPPRAARAARGSLAEEYRAALELFGKGRLDDSRAAFQRVFEADQNGELADNALYWMAETYFVTGKYADAMRLYRQILNDYSDQNKAPDAMLKTGLSYEKLGDLALARRTFEELIAKYPYSTPAATAKHEIKRIQY